MNVVLAGPPGSGKGTQAALLAQSAVAAHISTGELLRGAVASGTDLGRQVEGILERGDLVPDDLMMALIRDCLAGGGGGWLLDGFPRTVAQAEGLLPLLAELEQPVDAVLVLDVPDDEIVRRLAAAHLRWLRPGDGAGSSGRGRELPAVRGQGPAGACGRPRGDRAQPPGRLPRADAAGPGGPGSALSAAVGGRTRRRRRGSAEDRGCPGRIGSG